MSSKTLFSLILCIIFLAMGSSYYYYYYKSSILNADYTAHEGATHELVERIERDVIMAIKNDIADGKNIDLPIKAQIERVVKDIIVNNPEVVIDSLTKYNQKKQNEQYQKSNDKVKELLKDLEDAKFNPVYGAKNPTVKVVEFFDYSCGYCKKMFDINKRIVAKYPDVQFVYREFPMYPASAEATRAALAVNTIDPDKYIDFQERMFLLHGDKTRESVEAVAVDLGIDRALFKKALENPAIERTWQDNVKFMKEMGIQGTPVLIIGGKLVPGFIEFDEFDALIKSLNSKSDRKLGTQDDTRGDIVKDPSSSSSSESISKDSVANSKEEQTINDDKEKSSST